MPGNTRSAGRDRRRSRRHPASISTSRWPRKAGRSPVSPPSASRTRAVSSSEVSANARVAWKRASSRRCCKTPPATSATHGSGSSAKRLDVFRPQPHRPIGHRQPIGHGRAGHEIRPVEKRQGMGEVVHTADIVYASLGRWSDETQIQRLVGGRGAGAGRFAGRGRRPAAGGVRPHACGRTIPRRPKTWTRCARKRTRTGTGWSSCFGRSSARRFRSCGGRTLRASCGATRCNRSGPGTCSASAGKWP